MEGIADYPGNDAGEPAAYRKSPKIQKTKKPAVTESLAKLYHIGDSVMVLPNKKIWINHKRVKLQVSAKEMYPENYDFSIVFETVEHRKIRHDMERKYTEAAIEYQE